MTPREKHIAEMQRLAAAISKTKSETLKRDYQKRLKKMVHELKIYDSYRRGEMTQGERILKYIDEKGSITPMEAFMELGVTKLATRISELRRGGEAIKKKYVTGTNRFGEKVQYMEYTR